MNVNTKLEFHDATEYKACVDPLHRNTWPIRIDGDETVIGYLTEHITVSFDGPPPPAMTRWSWAFEDVEGNRLGIDDTLRASRGRYRTWRAALDVFVNMHQLAVSLRVAEAHLTAERARKGE